MSDEQVQWNLKLLPNVQLTIQITFPLLSVTAEIDERVYAKEIFLNNPEGFQASLFLHLGHFLPKANEASTLKRKG